MDQPLSVDRRRQFVIDGEAVVLGVDGVSDFEALHSRQHDEEVQLYAFDIVALDGCAACRYPCERPTWRDCSRAGRMASSWRLSSRAKSVPTYFAPPVTWDLRAWCRSGLIARIVPDGRRIG